MKTILDNTTRGELIDRINSLNENSKAQWGKMNIFQMLRHCVICEEMYLGKKKYQRSFIGLLFGRMGLKNMLKDDSPMGKNAPTVPEFRVSETSGDVSAEKRKWIGLIEEYVHLTDNDLIHWFFGKMTKEQVGQFVYKHSDHHLRQFNV